ncbi:PH domain-containing protein [Microbacterium sp. ASV49]|uniref:PH domain-containing protein n=1 Tax=Microbacterium candidum TaxID=3041922 RepID=A0ABT7MV07_9MICO|nr:PH domain-containing protein [Microbacterium sp. ASV49]MDL9978253.1 PH domain-containing protein [Microbacterium sp. ASV49]
MALFPGQASHTPLSDGEWHRMHPLTPLFRGGFVLVVVAGLIISNLRERLIALFLPVFAPEVPVQEVPGDPVDFILRHNLVLWALLIVLVVVIVLIGLFLLSWRFHTFRITGDHVEVRHGVLFRSHRRAPLDRVQGVNLTRPMFARLCGMAKLEVVGAGTDANVKLEYLSTANAEAVRADILRLASGLRLAKKEGAAPGRTGLVESATSTVSAALNGIILGDEAPVAEPASVVAIPILRLVFSHLLSWSTVVLALLLTFIIWGASVGTPWLLVSFIPALLGFGAYWLRRITRALRYSIAPTPDGVRITFGFFTTITEILPPGRVHAVEITQPLLWRPAGWWRVTINRLSGHRASSDSRAEEEATRVLPVGTRADVERVLRLLLPGLPADDWSLIVAHGILGADDDNYTTTPRRARLLHLLSWRRNGFLLSPDAIFLRRGRLHRRLAIFPLARTQSVGLSQGPIARAFTVAALHVHTVAGRVSGRLTGIDRDAAVQAFGDVERDGIAAASVDRSHRWGSIGPEDSAFGSPADSRASSAESAAGSPADSAGDPPAGPAGDPPAGPAGDSPAGPAVDSQADRAGDSPADSVGATA